MHSTRELDTYQMLCTSLRLVLYCRPSHEFQLLLLGHIHRIVSFVCARGLDLGADMPSLLQGHCVAHELDRKCDAVEVGRNNKGKLLIWQSARH